jgi:hypothetical protein
MTLRRQHKQTHPTFHKCTLLYSKIVHFLKQYTDVGAFHHAHIMAMGIGVKISPIVSELVHVVGEFQQENGVPLSVPLYLTCKLS